jgi:hypothetical protein
MPTQINGTTGIDQVQDDIISTAKVQDNAITPVKTQAGAPPSEVRLNTANGNGSTNTAIRRYTNVVTNQGTDITYADSATLGASFTINTDGVYAITVSDQFNAAGSVGLSLNSNQLTSSIGAITAANILSAATSAAANVAASCSATLALEAGDVVRPHFTAGTVSGTIPNIAQFIITRIA